MLREVLMDDVIAPVVEERPAGAAAAVSAAPHHVFLIDGSGFIFRAYFARARDPKVERFQRQSDGMATEVVMIFSNMLDKYLRETDADHIAVIFDASGRSFRNELYADYKANRREMPDDLAPQLAHVRRAAHRFDGERAEQKDQHCAQQRAREHRHVADVDVERHVLFVQQAFHFVDVSREQ